MKATVQAFRPTQFGFQVKTDKGTYYVPSQLFPAGIDTGVQVEFEEHKKGQPYPASFGKAGEFKQDGIHDIFIVSTTDRLVAANAVYTAKMQSALSEA